MDYEALDKNANLGAFSTLDAAIVLPEVAKLKPGQVYLEVGVDKGKSLSLARMVADEDVEVIGVDLRNNPKVPGTLFFQGDSVQMSVVINRQISVLFIDGDHSYEGCRRDIEAYYPLMAKKGVMLFHDCDETSPGVVQAVKEFAEEYNLEVYYAPDQRCSMARIYL